MPIYPDDLPSILFYRMVSRVVVLLALPRRPVESMGSSGITNAPIVRRSIPPGADGWRIDSGDWKPLSEIPKHWLPFLER